jgi:hypothetical protein
MPLAIAPIVMEAPLIILDLINTLIALVALSVSLVLVLNLIPHQGLPFISRPLTILRSLIIPRPLTISGLPLSQTTYT